MFGGKVNSEDRIIELINKFNTTGEINISEFKSAAFYDYPPDTLLSPSPTGIINWGVVDSIEEISDESARHYRITTSKQIQYSRKIIPTEI